jgi:hypothetical protein
MLIAAALSLALIQDPVTHDQAVTCNGVFAFLAVITASAMQSDPTPQSEQAFDAAGRLVNAARADREAAARREGIRLDQSEQALNTWLEINLPNSEAVIRREIQPCLRRYQSVV